MSGRMGFVGVTTSGSSIMQIFPVWATELGLPTSQLDGHDVAIGASSAEYRALVTTIRDDPEHRGALVTTHKMALFAAAHDLFDELDEFALACGEVSSIAKRDGRLLGHAKDPLTVGLALDEFVAADAFVSERDAVILGAGGAGLALSWHLAQRNDVPRRIVVSDTDRSRLDHLADVHAILGTDAGLLHLVDASDESMRTLFATLAHGSLVVNASGLGKDRPGSPLPDDIDFPPSAVVWEFNYRGSLEFLAHARDQAERNGLTVVDGWRYFIHGWTQVIGEVFEVDMTPKTVERLAQLAEPFRR